MLEWIPEEFAKEADKALDAFIRFVAIKHGRFNRVEVIRSNPHETVVIRDPNGNLVGVVTRKV